MPGHKQPFHRNLQRNPNPNIGAPKGYKSAPLTSWLRPAMDHGPNRNLEASSSGSTYGAGHFHKSLPDRHLRISGPKKIQNLSARSGNFRPLHHSPTHHSPLTHSPIDHLLPKLPHDDITRFQLHHPALEKAGLSLTVYRQLLPAAPSLAKSSMAVAKTVSALPV